MAPKSTFVLSESPFWPKLPLSRFSFGTQRAMVSNVSLMDKPGIGIKIVDYLKDYSVVNGV